MRKLLTFVVLVSVSFALWTLSHARAATGTNDGATFYSNLRTGDDVKLYLSHAPSSSDYVDGTLTAFDGITFQVSGEKEAMCAKAGVTGLEHRKVLYIVPRESVTFIEKTLSTEFVPSTQP